MQSAPASLPGLRAGAEGQVTLEGQTWDIPHGSPKQPPTECPLRSEVTLGDILGFTFTVFYKTINQLTTFKTRDILSFKTSRFLAPQGISHDMAALDHQSFKAAVTGAMCPLPP